MQILSVCFLSPSPGSWLVWISLNGALSEAKKGKWCSGGAPPSPEWFKCKSSTSCMDSWTVLHSPDLPGNATVVFCSNTLCIYLLPPCECLFLPPPHSNVCLPPLSLPEANAATPSDPRQTEAAESKECDAKEEEPQYFTFWPAKKTQSCQKKLNKAK